MLTMKKYITKNLVPTIGKYKDNTKDIMDDFKIYKFVK